MHPRATQVSYEGTSENHGEINITLAHDGSGEPNRFELFQNVPLSDTVMFNYDTLTKHAQAVGGIEEIYQCDEGCWEFSFTRVPNATQLMMFLELCLADDVK